MKMSYPTDHKSIVRIKLNGWQTDVKHFVCTKSKMAVGLIFINYRPEIITRTRQRNTKMDMLQFYLFNWI